MAQATPRKMSEILKEMAESQLRDPSAVPSSEAMEAVLLLANVAWNKSLGIDASVEDYRPILRQFESEHPGFWEELRSRDAEAMVDDLIRYKKAHHPDDGRRI